MIGVPVARILGIEVRLQLGWVLVVALVAALAAIQIAEVEPSVSPALQWLLGGVVALGFFVSALIHDLAHAILARRRGVEVERIVISFFGGATPLDPASPDPGDELAIAVAGPAVSIVLGGLLAGVATALGSMGGPASVVAAQVLAVLAVLNLVLGLVNVIPAYPLDGGRIVRAAAWLRTGDVRRGWLAAAAVGRAVGIVIIVIGLGVILMGQLTNGAMIALSGWFLLLSSRAIRERTKVEDLIGDLTVGDVMERDTPTVHPGLTVDTFAGQLLDRDVPVTAIPVISDADVVGILGARQVQRLRPQQWINTRVEDVMARPPRLPIVGPDDGLVDAVEKLHRANLDGIPVVDGSRLVGVLTRRSIGLAVQSRTRRVAPDEAEEDGGPPPNDDDTAAPAP
ncbi:MAG TPA: site-2 protease family protein [Candidatus Limnocylindrales bacterium]|nr:site-2 protease family protein [Candidatus Limnocylindrales bacterium]